MTRMIKASTALVMALALAASGCSSDGASSGDPDARSASGDAQTQVTAPSEADGTARTFDPATRDFMMEGLRQFSGGDPAWPATRRRWLSMGRRESDFLVGAMFAALLAAQRVNAPDLVQRARHELVLIGEPYIEFLAGILATGTVATIYDRIEEKEKPIRVDDDTRREAAEVLALIGGPAAAATARSLDRAETKSGRRFALQALGNMGDRGGRVAGDALARWAHDDDWVLRVEAVHGLRSFSDAATRVALETALRDDEKLVRENAVRGLMGRRDRASLPALRRALTAAQDSARLGEARHIRSAIARIEAR